MGEDLHHLLAVDHLLHKAVEGTQRALLADEILGRPLHNEHGHGQNAHDGEDHHNGQHPGGLQHGDKDHRKGDGGADGLGNGLGDHLPQGVDVAGVAGHDVAGGVGVEIAQGQTLHFGEHLIPDGLLGALTDTHHQKLLQKGAHHAHGKDAADFHKEGQQRGEVGASGFHHGQNVIIHQSAQGFAAGGLGDGGAKNTQQNHNQNGDVLLHVAQQPQQHLFGVLGLAAVAAHSYRGHDSSPPFCWE